MENQTQMKKFSNFNSIKYIFHIIIINIKQQKNGGTKINI